MKVILVTGTFVAAATCFAIAVAASDDDDGYDHGEVRAPPLYNQHKSRAYASDESASPSSLVKAVGDDDEVEDEDYGEVRPIPLYNRLRRVHRAVSGWISINPRPEV
ncbi:uncharacterized protein LOC135400745 isoform X2 [Ornithodoros turicata]|uniref:uncharacterized protein LOC135400745 isoform X2 n=1 Tax=Ornithodoros turicata TaxID=34597 RepID=UPI00313985D9